MAGLHGQDLTTDNDESVGVIADGQTGSGVRAKVASDGTDNRLYVDSKVSVPPGVGPNVDNTLRYIDMNAANGGIARQTDVDVTYVDVFDTDDLTTATGGLLFHFSLALEGADKEWDIKLTVDGTVVFEIDSGDVYNDQIWYQRFNSANNYALVPGGLGVRENKMVFWHSPSGFPMTWSSRILLQVKRTNGMKKFRGGVVTLTGATE